MNVCVCEKNPTWTYPAITSQENGVTLYVPVYDALHMQVGQSLEHRQTHSGDLLLVHPVRTHVAATSTLKKQQDYWFMHLFSPSTTQTFRGIKEPDNTREKMQKQGRFHLSVNILSDATVWFIALQFRWRRTSPLACSSCSFDAQCRRSHMEPWGNAAHPTELVQEFTAPLNINIEAQLLIRGRVCTHGTCA